MKSYRLHASQRLSCCSGARILSPQRQYSAKLPRRAQARPVSLWQHAHLPREDGAAFAPLIRDWRAVVVEVGCFLRKDSERNRALGTGRKQQGRPVVGFVHRLAPGIEGFGFKG